MMETCGRYCRQSLAGFFDRPITADPIHGDIVKSTQKPNMALLNDVQQCDNIVKSCFQCILLNQAVHV